MTAFIHPQTVAKTEASRLLSIRTAGVDPKFAYIGCYYKTASSTAGYMAFLCDNLSEAESHMRHTCGCEDWIFGGVERVAA